MSSAILDASALLALLKQEPGGSRVAAAIKLGAAMSAVNYSEVIAKLASAGVPLEEIRRTLEDLQLEVVPFGGELAYQTGRLRSETKAAGLSFADRACLALAQARALPVITTDRVWADLQLGVTIQVVR